MAFRIHVTAVRDSTAAEVQAVMSEVIRPACARPAPAEGGACPAPGGALEICEHGGWTWFRTSVWAVSAADPNRGLCKLARPGLQFTTSDGDRWYLTVHGGPGGQAHFLHEFRYHSHLYERFAREWAAERGLNLFEVPWLERFLGLVPAGGSILDIGCGSGRPIAQYFIEKGYAVMGVDSSPSLIEMCRQCFPDNEWAVADMRTMSLGRRFHGLLAWHSFFHLSREDQRGVFPVFRAHAAPGAALMFTSGPSAGEAIGSWCGSPLYHGSLDAAEYRSLLADNGFAVVSHVIEDPACGHATVWLARFSARD